MYLTNELQTKLGVSISSFESLNTILVFTDTLEEYEYNLFELLNHNKDYEENILRGIDSINKFLILYNGGMLIKYRHNKEFYNFYKGNLTKLDYFLRSNN